MLGNQRIRIKDVNYYNTKIEGGNKLHPYSQWFTKGIRYEIEKLPPSFSG